jgi:hypothetical protein
LFSQLSGIFPQGRPLCTNFSAVAEATLSILPVAGRQESNAGKLRSVELIAI